MPQAAADEIVFEAEVKGEAGKIYASVVVACSYSWGSPEREAIARAYQETVTVLLWIALGLCIPLLGTAAMSRANGGIRVSEGA